MNKSLKRLQIELANYGKTTITIGEETYFEIDKGGIYLRLIDEDNLYEWNALIVGPKDTPYEGGFYMFKIKVLPEYPFVPPYVEFLTTDGKIRFNPNLYQSGKVCLSILGTWTGPSWCSTMNLDTVCQYLRYILNEQPLANEPGYDIKLHKKDFEQYNRIIEWRNMDYAIHTLITTNKFPKFTPVMKQLFKDNYDNYQKMFEKLEEHNDKTFSLGYQTQSATPKYNDLKKKYEKLYKSL
jgi:ubiquitin-protein ligase